MTKMFTFLIALMLIFSCATCYAAESKPVYDRDEKIFVEDFNAMAKAMSVEVIDTNIKNLPNGAHELSGRNLKLNLNLNQAGGIENISVSSTDKKRLSEGVIVTLAVIGLSEDEFNELFKNQNSNEISVWCKFAKRRVIVEKKVNGNNIEALIKADAEK